MRLQVGPGRSLNSSDDLQGHWKSVPGLSLLLSPLVAPTQPSRDLDASQGYTFWHQRACAHFPFGQTPFFPASPTLQGQLISHTCPFPIIQVLKKPSVDSFWLSHTQLSLVPIPKYPAQQREICKINENFFRGGVLFTGFVGSQMPTRDWTWAVAVKVWNPNH